MFDQKVILVTGGTGSFGQNFIQKLLTKHSPKKVIVYSRDEMKQWHMEQRMSSKQREIVRFFIGDVRDKERLSRALDGVDYVVHAAAMKIVPSAEYNPFECVKTNIIGAMNLIDTCIDRGVKRIVALSTDKASSPINLYGATKLASDKLFVAANSYSGNKDTRFSVVRYGNVMGSRGSVVPYFLQLKRENATSFPITDIEMTRFMITLDQGLDLVMTAFEDMLGGEIYVKKIPSIRVVDIANAIDPNIDHKHIGIRPGEKIHEQMIGAEDALVTYEYADYFKILPVIQTNVDNKLRIKGGVKVPSNFLYSSDRNDQWLTSAELLEIIDRLEL